MNCGCCVPWDQSRCPRCGREVQESDPLCATGQGEIIANVGAFPVTTQVSLRQEVDPNNPQQVVERQTVSTQHHPWKTSEIREMQKDFTDPNKQPQQCADYLRRMQDIYKATWTDMTQLGRAILGQQPEREVEAHAAADGAVIAIPGEQDRRTVASGETYVQKLAVWATTKAANLPAIQMGRQASTQTVRNWYDKCLEAHEAGGFNPAEVKDRLIIKQSFLGGLQPALRKRLYEIRPEADRMRVEDVLDVLSAVEEQEERKKKQAPIYVVMPQGEQAGLSKGGNPKLGPCYFCKKSGHLKRDCGKYQAWLKKNGKAKEKSE